MTFATTLLSTDDCIVRLSEMKEYIENKLNNEDTQSVQSIQDELQDVLLEMYHILSKDLL